MMSCPLCHARQTRDYAFVDGEKYYRCSDCALVFLSPQQLPSKQTEKALYDQHRNDPADDGYRTFLSQVSVPLTAQLPPGASGLDYGCGPGPALVAMMRERGFSCEGYDPIYACDTQLLEGRYDFVTCTEVVEHFHHPGRDFDTLVTLLNPGGWLAIMTRWLTDDVDFQRWHYRRDPTHVCFYNRDTFEWIARHHGLRACYPQDHVTLLQKRGP